jgi:hypothetical protein
MSVAPRVGKAGPLGIFVWLAIMVVIATRLFKWEVV